MDSVLFTPKSAMSSVFMTPPLSLERNSQEENVTFGSEAQFPSFSLFTPAKNANENGIDFIVRLYGSFRHITDNILTKLRTSDLCSCLAVSKSWRCAVLSNRSLVNRIQEHRKRLKVDRENVSAKELIINSPPNTPRAPLSIRDSNCCPSTQWKDSSPIVVTKFTLPDEKLRPCPQCSSPAKSITEIRSQCGICQFDFCPKCLKPTHIQSSCKITISPKKREASIAGGSKSKKRLKRL